jgi:hypothetical protein
VPLDSTTQSITWYDRGVIGRAWDEELTGEIGRIKSEATRIIRCMWSDRFHVAAWLKGGFDPVFGYIAPQTLPYEAGTGLTNTNLYVNKVKWRGREGTNAQGQPVGRLQLYASDGTPIVGYKYALLTVEYGTLDWLAQQQLGTLGLDYGTQWVTTPDPQTTGTPTYKFATGGQNIEEAQALPLTVIELNIGRYHMASIPVATVMMAAKSPLNSVTLTNTLFPGLPNGQATPGTVMFSGCHDERAIDSFGNPSFNLTYKLKWRSIPWDQGINPTTGLWDQIINIQTGLPIIPRSDLSILMTGTA